MQNNFRRLLQHFAQDLREETKSTEHRALVQFIIRYAARISHDFLSRIALKEGSPGIDDKEKEQNFLKGQVGCADDLDDEGEIQDQEIGTFEDELYDGSLRELEHIRNFVVRSLAFQSLRQKLYRFVHPSMTTELRGLIKSWLAPGNKRAHLVESYKLSNLVTELQYIPTSQIRIGPEAPPAGRASVVINLVKSKIEGWTGESWDWWPLKPCKRPLNDSEVRVSWKCVSISVPPSLLSLPVLLAVTYY